MTGLCFGSRTRPVPASLAVLIVAVSLGACGRSEPLLRPEVGERLRRAPVFNTDAVLREPEVTVDEVPAEPASEALQSAQAAVRPKPDEAFALTLPEARQHALTHNLSLRVDRFDPTIAQQSYHAQLARFEAVLSAQVRWDSSHDLTDAQTAVLSLEPSVEVPLETGGRASLRLPYSRQDSDTLDFTTEEPVGVSHGPGLSFSLSQPLLRNAGLSTNRAPIHTALLRVRQADARTRVAMIRLLANTERTYWQYYAAHEDLKIQLQQHELAQEQLRAAQRLVDEGVRTTVEVTRARSGVARRFESIIRAETGRRRLERALKRVLNVPALPIDSARPILISTPPSLIKRVFHRDKLLELAWANRMELFDNELEQAIDRTELAASDNATLPGLSFDFSYSFSGSQSELDTAIEQLWDSELNNYGVGLVAEIPLGNAAARARHNRALLTQARTRASREVLRQGIAQEVYDAADALEQNWHRILSNRLAVALAAETYEAEKLQFQLAVITSTEVLDALSALAAAQSAEIQAIADYQISRVDLAFATGTILGQNGITWAPATSDE